MKKIFIPMAIAITQTSLKALFSVLMLSTCITHHSVSAMDVDENEKVDFQNHENVYQKFYAVHVSPILLNNCTAIAGSLNDGRIIPDCATIHCRKTLHHCVGGVVPHQALQSVIYHVDGHAT